MTSADQVAADAAARVSSWASLSADERAALAGDIALVTCRDGVTHLSWRGVERQFGDVFEALAQARVMGLPDDRIKVAPLQATSTSRVLAESPSLRVL